MVGISQKIPTKEMYVVERKNGGGGSVSGDLIEYMPEKSHKSIILTDIQLSNLIRCLPSFYR